MTSHQPEGQDSHEKSKDCSGRKEREKDEFRCTCRDLKRNAVIKKETSFLCFE